MLITKHRILAEFQDPRDKASVQKLLWRISLLPVEHDYPEPNVSKQIYHKVPYYEIEDFKKALEKYKCKSPNTCKLRKKILKILKNFEEGEKHEMQKR